MEKVIRFFKAGVNMTYAYRHFFNSFFNIIAFIILVNAAVITSGCGGSPGQTGESPSGLTYTTTSAVYTKDLAIAENKPSVNGTVSSWSVNPDLPSGLGIDPATGVITGTPSAEQGALEYTITASGDSGSTTAVISITVNNAAPAALSYRKTSAVYTKDIAITENDPTVTVTVSSWSVDPELPDGLALDSETGVISGTPVNEQGAVIYVITAANSGGSTTAEISIAVNRAAPAALSYSPGTTVYTKGLAIPENVPVVTGTVSSWSVDPELPEGLTLDTETGVISGTPVSEQAASIYKITASNTGGSATVEISITINSSKPEISGYTYQNAVYTVDEVIPGSVPVYTGTVSSWSVIPDLPAGLTLNTTTGVISGTPSSVQDDTEYTITASNSGGSDSITISIEVNHKAPSNLSYLPASAVFTQGTVIDDIIPTVTGTVSSWSVTPNLPAGLILNTTTGVISGTPENIQPETEYTITASNSGGSTQRVINIKVNYAPPAALVYSPSSVVFGYFGRSRGSFSSIEPNLINIVTQKTSKPHMDPLHYEARSFSMTPHYNGMVTEWSISGTLPAGVSFNTTTGVISGYGYMTRGTSVTLTVTAGNSGGSVSTVVVIYGP